MEPHLSYYSLPIVSAPEQSHSIACYEWGDAANDRVLVCVHGLTRNARDFDFLARKLSAHYRVIAPDMAGRGGSDVLVGSMDYNYGQYVADMLALLDRLHISRCDWVGTSMGGIIGMMIASLAPDRIGHLVLNDIGALVPASGLERISRYAGVNMDFVDRAKAEAHLRVIFAPFGIPSEAAWQHLFTHSLKNNAAGGVSLNYDARIMDVIRVQTENYKDFKDVDLSAVWEKITAPTLILRGEQSDILLHKTARAMCESNPRAALVEIPGVGHAPALMSDEQIHLIEEWLVLSR